MAGVTLTDSGVGLFTVLRPSAPVVIQRIAGEEGRLIRRALGAQTADCAGLVIDCLFGTGCSRLQILRLCFFSSEAVCDLAVFAAADRADSLGGAGRRAAVAILGFRTAGVTLTDSGVGLLIAVLRPSAPVVVLAHCRRRRSPHPPCPRKPQLQTAQDLQQTAFSVQVAADFRYFASTVSAVKSWGKLLPIPALQNSQTAFWLFVFAQCSAQPFFPALSVTSHIGKIAIPDTILNKPSKLSEEEFSIIKEHTIIGANILKNISLIDHVQEIVRNHHERYDGNGYPDGLKGKEIPLHARIVAVADSYDAMSSQRIYRNQLPPEKIIQELENNKGTQFDPEITDIFLKLLREDRIHVKEDHLSITENTQIPEAEIEMSQFISDIMSTIRTQKTKENLDFLTGLPTRNKGEQAIAQLMKRHSGCLVFMDMDNLKTINDIYGHKAGDRVLKLLGNLLLEYSSECLVCRLGGDEFLLFMPNADQNSITEVITAIFKKFNTRKEQDPELHAASISAGLYMCNIGDSFDECYTKADKALYFVKQNGKSDFSFYRQISESGCDDHTG